MSNLSIAERIDGLVTSITTQFNNRAVIENTKKGKTPSIFMSTKIEDNKLWLCFVGTQTLNVTIPLPYIEDGVTLIKNNEVVRAVCGYWLEKEQRDLDYIAAMYSIVCADSAGLISDDLVKGYPFLQQMIFAFDNKNPSIVAYRFQRAINEVVNKMPLHKTNLNSWVMNNRLLIIDEAFDELRSPAERLNYQVKKAKKYFSRGWTSIGLSDGTLADKNYILTSDLRKLSPFGIRYHNPQRNLYATLSMKGDELPKIVSKSAKDLMDQGITRTGWNLFTLFVDVPDIFEDQLIVDNIHKDKSVTYTRRFQIFGALFVKVNDVIHTGSKLGASPDDELNLFTVACDHAKVKSISETTTNVGGAEVKIHDIVVEYTRKFKDGLKLTNMHGNKGVIRLMDLGYAIDPRTGEERKIDIIVGAKTVGKRKNYGQVMEALLSNVVVDEPTVLPDDWYISDGDLKNLLKLGGFNDQGTWACETTYGRLTGICGEVFWGCINTPEDQIWKKGATTVCDSKNIRRAGLKFSHVEFRALKTRFGDDNPILDEIMGYAQGAENLHELFTMIKAKTGVLPKHLPVMDVTNTKPLDQVSGTIVAGQYINGTVVDEFFMPDGFIFKLPMPYQTAVANDGEVIYEGFPTTQEETTISYSIDSIYIPSGLLRKCWRHDSGKYGLNDIGTIVNNVITMAHRVVQNPRSDTLRGIYYRQLKEFFVRLSTIIGTKRGQLANCGMAIRYPFSVKGVATLSTTLPKNTVEIHRTMADQLNVKNGDVVIVERFPCLGFMSVRPQKVRVTDDIMCKYTIRASGNSLVSQNLDFDGDTLFVASFHTPEAKEALSKEWTNPNVTCYTEIRQLNERKGAPHIKCYSLDDYKIKPFDDLTNEVHAVIVEKNTGIKAQTGPIIALTYNLMRIVENSNLEKNQKFKVGVEMFLEKAAQSVFEQKHGGQSLHEIVIRSVCTGDVEKLVEKGFKRGTTTMLVKIVKQKAAMLGITDLVKYHKQVERSSKSNIISLIVREQNRIYFASRSKLEGLSLIRTLAEDAVDIPSRMFKWVMAGKTDVADTKLEEIDLEKKLEVFTNDEYKDSCASLCSIIQNVFKGMKLDFSTGEYSYAKTVGCRG